MYFDEKYIQSLPEDPYEVVKNVCEKGLNHISKLSGSDQYELIIEVFALLSSYKEATDLGIESPPQISRDKDYKNISTSYLGQLQASAETKMGNKSYQLYKDKFGALLGVKFHYEFSDGDLDRIQQLINKLRDIISETKGFNEEHKQRLLRRLEKFQAELHKRVSDLDRFWGILFDFSTVIGLMGENAKPMVGVIKEIVGIIWPVQARTYGLASDLPFKLLGSSEDDKPEDKQS